MKTWSYSRKVALERCAGRGGSLSSDAGFSLIELLIAMFLASGVLFLIAVMVFGIYSVQHSVMDSSHSSGETQTFSELFKQSIRSSTATQLTAVTVGAQKGQLLKARVLVNTDASNTNPAGRCQQFLWLGTKIYSSNTASSTTAPTVTTLSKWVNLVADVVPVVGGSGIFSQTGLVTSVDLLTNPDHGLGAVVSTSQSAPDVPQVSSPCF